MNKLQIVKRDLSPISLKIIGVLIFLATGYKILTQTFFEVNPLVYLVLNTIAIAIWTGKELIVIDFQNNLIGEGFRILGMMYLDKTKFSAIEKVYINKVNSVQIFRHLTRTIDIHHQNYKAFLKTSDGIKICIGIDTDKDELIKRLKVYNEKIKTDIVDNTLPQPSVI